MQAENLAEPIEFVPDEDFFSSIYRAIKENDVPDLVQIMEFHDLTELTIKPNPLRQEIIMNGNPSTLCAAAFNCSIDALRYLLSCAHFAAAGGNIEILSLLQENGVNYAESFDNDNNTPIHYASSYGQLTAIKWLWSNGCSIDTLNNSNFLPIHSAALHSSTENNMVGVIDFLLENGNSIESRTKNQYTPLMLAARSNSIDIIEHLLAKGADLNAKDNNEEINSLIICCQLSFVKAATIFIEHGIDVNYTMSSTKWGALHTSIKAKSFDLVHLLLANGARVNEIDIYHMTPLHWAAKFGLIDIVRILIQYNADTDLKSKEGWTPLSIASCYGSTECAKFLAEQGADINVADKHSITPFMFACLNGQMEIARYFVEKGVDLSIRDVRGWTVLHWAAANDRMDMVKYVLELGVDPKIRDKDRNTAYDLAKQHKYTDIVEYMENCAADTHSNCVIA